MPRIQVLPDVLASQVAAGEVVERPASVVKELVENSIDAGAREVLVEIRRGGAALIRVTDDGSGMGREDARMCLERHATSKLQSAADLLRIRTLGFRGEAIPSMASVSRFRLKTRTAEEVAGTEIEVEGGQIGPIRDAGCPVGTVMEVRDLFFNVPARKKFLKTESTESAHIEHQLRLHALAAAQVRIRFRKDDREVFDLPAGLDRLDRLRQILGLSVGRELMRLEPTEATGLRVEGFILPHGHARRGRRHQCIFLNGRPVEDAAISRGLVEGFRGGLQEGLHPAAWLWIEMDPAWVDVNVHPAKREIRLRKPHDLREAIAAAVMGASSALQPPKAIEPETSSSERGRPVIPNRPESGVPKVSVARPVMPSVPAARAVWQPVAVERPLISQEPVTEAAPAGPGFRLIGTLLGRFALLESSDGLVVLDPRAARERIWYEKLMAAGGQSVHTQSLLVPLLLEPGPREVELLLAHREGLASAGFEIGDFGGGCLQVMSAPDFVKPEEVQPLLLDLADELADEATLSRRFADERLAKSLARKAALREKARPEEAMVLLEALFQCDLPYCAADGRPTLSEFSMGELERRFGLSK
ncbi:DNA mismatch repair protein MutL [Haloferula luteola]|uniref:DNA mismatch repair protein MutL n=1 Tax=Haloferula luteola TaxID=595692 RepID=A0A840V6T2_9BACT|nr:DNA mismatch repair protein MutL [Haloferula luteola]